MSEYEIKNERLWPLIEKGIATTLDSKHCREFDDYLCKEYPWVKYTDRIDWAKVRKKYKRFNWHKATKEETKMFLKSTCLNHFEEVCIIYGANEPGLIVTFDYACDQIENLTIFGWATTCMVGISRSNYGIIELNYDCFLEIDSTHWLTAVGN